MNAFRKLINAETIVSLLLLLALLTFVFQLLPLGLQVANAKEGTTFIAYVLAISSGIVKAFYQPAILLGLAAIIELKKGQNA